MFPQADPGVDCNAALGLGDDRIEIELGNLGEVVRETGQAQVQGTEIKANGRRQDHAAGVSLVVQSLSLDQPPSLVNQHVSCDYGQLRESVSACWRVSGHVSKLSWKIYPTK